jgi:hypothetical protein
MLQRELSGLLLLQVWEVTSTTRTSSIGYLLVIDIWFCQQVQFRVLVRMLGKQKSLRT